jgi:hypothetical protein
MRNLQNIHSRMNVLIMLLRGFLHNLKWCMVEEAVYDLNMWH